ncbi:MAG: hypothetical protein FWD69_14335 [Polyangiaceae bacterium]|nr:hypothetical protein [Polyangiaceae bacterium]
MRRYFYWVVLSVLYAAAWLPAAACAKFTVADLDAGADASDSEPYYVYPPVRPTYTVTTLAGTFDTPEGIAFATGRQSLRY